MTRAETLVGVGGAGFGASLTVAVSVLSGRAAETLGLSSLASYLHALVVGLYAVAFAGLIFLALRDRLRPSNPVLRLWLNTFAFFVALILMNSQLRLLTSRIARAFQSWPLAGQLYSLLGTPVGAQLRFLTPVIAAAFVSILMLTKEGWNSRYPALRKAADIFS